MAFQLRTAVGDDVPAIADVFRRSSLSNDGDRDVLLANPDALVFDDTAVHHGLTRVCVNGDHIVGFATSRPMGEVEELDDLFVDPEWTRRGIARHLIDDACAIARSRGAHRIEVTANEHALAFYRSVGFVVVGTARTEFGPASRLHLDLSARSPEGQQDTAS